ncbi:MAG: CapA family protein [Armatimonadetes bacterium]|nr:CapA family protein [Armatimonadota bacterium]
MIFSLVLAAQSWTLVVGGDIMLNGVKPGVKVFTGISSWTKAADIATANLEIPLTNARASTPNKSAAEVKAKSQFILKADPGHARAIGAAGLDLVGLGNNHAMDYRFAGLNQMTGLLDGQGIQWCGAGKDLAEAARTQVVTAQKSMKVAFVSFLAFKTSGGLGKCTPATEVSPGVATLPFNGKLLASQRKRLKAIVAQARSTADFVVVWLHWGTERKTVPDPWQVTLGRGFIEAGADCVLGAHPHVLQGAELYAGKPIFYSLGNLVSPIGSSTGIFRLTFNGRKLSKAEMLPCVISGGTVKAGALAARAKSVAAFESLCRKATTKYRHPKSIPLDISEPNGAR